MPADIYRDSMAFTGATPWHGIGTRLPAHADGATIYDAAKMYDVRELPVYAFGKPDPIEGYKALSASDDGRILSVVGADYGVVQFRDAINAVVQAAGGTGAIFETAGLLGADGARGWVMGRLPGDIEVRGDSSPIARYFSAYLGHDGQTTVSLLNHATRIVCSNTLGMAMGENIWKVSIRHTSNALMRVEDAATAFARLNKSFEQFGELANALAARPFSGEQLNAAIDRVVPVVPPEARNRDQVMADRAKIAELAENGRGMDGIRGTAWGAFQSFTEWADHHRTIRAQKEIDQLQARALNLTFGPGAEVKSAALSTIRRAVGL